MTNNDTVRAEVCDRATTVMRGRWYGARTGRGVVPLGGDLAGTGTQMGSSADIPAGPGVSLRLFQQPQSALHLGRDHPALLQHPG
jgi:hypothetical protein